MPLNPNATLQGEEIECSDCGLAQRLPPPLRGTVLECGRCGQRLSGSGRANLEISLAFSGAALLLLVPAVLAPLMSLITFGARRSDWLYTGVFALWLQGYAALAAAIFLFSMAIPFVYLALMVWVLSSTLFSPRGPRGDAFRWAGALRPWAMTEVYLVGCCVAFTRLQDIGDVHIGIGGWSLLGSAFAVSLGSAALDERAVWRAARLRAPGATAGRPMSCGSCELRFLAAAPRSRCPRCRRRPQARQPHSLERTLALVVAGFLLYLPANVLPVLAIERFGREAPSTILGGVSELLSNGLWPLAAVVFTASILVPLLKLCGLSLMLLLTHRRSGRWLRGRARLYRFIEFIGRWSSIDLFMISILVALVQFGTLTRVRPEGGAAAFAAVVVITMIAARCFDPRLMWDAAREPG
jgi:paraquat-inducible protein A